MYKNTTELFFKAEFLIFRPWYDLETLNRERKQIQIVVLYYLNFEISIHMWPQTSNFVGFPCLI